MSNARHSNYPDALMVQGRYQIKPPLPLQSGNGHVRHSGQGGKQGRPCVKGRPGGRIPRPWCICRGLPRVKGKVSPLPDSMPFHIGAACGLTYATVVHAFLGLHSCPTGRDGAGPGRLGRRRAPPPSEVAKAMGATAIAAASSDDKLAPVHQLGADMAINYNQEDLRKRTLEMTGGKGVDVVFDPVGGEFSLALYGPPPGEADCWSSVLPPARFPKSPSTMRCSASVRS